MQPAAVLQVLRFIVGSGGIYVRCRGCFADVMAKPAFISRTVSTKALMIGECARSL